MHPSVFFHWESPPARNARRQLPWDVMTRLLSSNGQLSGGWVKLHTVPASSGLRSYGAARPGRHRENTNASLGRGSK
eukprot:7831662-Pyramimonas_sp.AAC.1